MRPGSVDHGRYVYAYCNVRTNQVVYSLTRALNNHNALKQLPDVGANNKPRALRKDLWRPLYTVSMQDSKAGHAQGLDAFRRLREYRRLHETSWKPPALLARPYTEAEIEELQEKLDERGGSKKESVYDIIKREKKKLRVRAVLDQKAKSIADLAAVLAEQDEQGAEMAQNRGEEWRSVREAEVTDMLGFALDADSGGLEELTEQLEKGRTLAGQSQNELRQIHSSVHEEQEKVARLKSKRVRMVFAAKAVGEMSQLVRQAKAGGKEILERKVEEVNAALQSAMEQNEEDVDQSEVLLMKRKRSGLQTRLRRMHKIEEMVDELQRMSQEAKVAQRTQLNREINNIRSNAGQDQDSAEGKERMASRLHELEQQLSRETDVTPEKEAIMRQIQETEAKLQHDQQGLRDLEAAGDLLSFAAKRQIRAKLGTLERRSTDTTDEGEREIVQNEVADLLSQLERDDQVLRERNEAGLTMTSDERRAMKDEVRQFHKQLDRIDAGDMFGWQRILKSELEKMKEQRERAGMLQSTSTDGTQAASSSTSNEPRSPFLDSLIPLFPVFPPKISATHPSNVPKRHDLRRQHQRLHAPIFTSQGVTIKWDDILDAEFAESWPADVSHEPMGLLRHTAPKPDAEAVRDVGEFWKQTPAHDEQRRLAKARVMRKVHGWKELADGLVGRVKEAEQEERRRMAVVKEGKRTEMEA